MAQLTGERSFTLELTLSDLVTLITAVEAMDQRLVGLRTHLMSAFVPTQPQNPFEGKGGLVSEEEMRKLFGLDPDGTSAEEVGSEISDAPTEKKIDFEKDLEH